MSGDLGDFFSLIGKAKQEKEDEFRSLVGEIDIDSIFAETKKSLKEDKKKKKKIEKQAKALEAWLYTETPEKTKIEETEEPLVIGDAEGQPKFEVIDVIKPEPLGKSKIVEEQKVIEEPEEDDTIDHALKILEQLKTKEEVQEQTSDPEILKIRRELEYLKNLVNMQGGGGEVRLEFLDDVDRDTALVDGKFLKYQSSTKTFVGADASGGGGSDYASVAGIATFATTAGIATFATTAGIATFATTAGIATFATTAGIATFATTAGIATFATTAGIATFATTAGIATDAVSAGYAKTAGISTVSQGLTGSPSISVNAITATSAEFSGNVTIGGTLTYEDVTNIDSVGIITARLGVNVTGGQIAVGAAFSVGQAGVVTASSFVGNLTGDVTGDVTGNADTATLATTATYAVNAGLATEATYAVNAGLATEATYAVNAGLATEATYAITAGVSTNVNGGIATVTSLVLPQGLISSGVTTTTTTSESSIDSFSTSSYRSAKYLIQINQGSSYNITEVSLVHDGSNSYGTEYGTVRTGISLASFNTDINSGNVRLLATPASSSSTTFKLVRTLIESGPADAGSTDSIVSTNLLVHLDAKEYSGSGSTWSDETSNGYDATLHNTPVYNSGNEGYFEMSGDYISLGTQINSAITETNVSFSMWVYLNATGSDETLIAVPSLTGNKPLVVWYDASAALIQNTGSNDVGGATTNVISVMVTDSSSSKRFSTGANALTATTWHNVVVVLDTTNNIFYTYIDGVESAKWVDNNTSLGIDPGSNAFNLGGTGTFLDGRIAHFLAYNKALSASEVLTNYNALKSRYS